MTTPNGKHEFEAGVECLERIRDHYGTHPTITFEWIEGERQRQIESAIAALQDYPKLKAEVEQNKALITDLTRDMNEEHDRAEKAEAENESLKLRINKLESWLEDALFDKEEQ